MSQRFVVTRQVTVNQALVIKANNASEAIELSRKSAYKDWSTENAKRSGYKAVEFTA